MSISDKIQALEASRQAIAAAITQKGGTVAQGDGFSQFAAEILNLPSGGSGNEVIKSIDAASATPSYMGSSSIQYLTYFIEEIHWPATLSFPFNFANFYNNNQLPFLKKITVDVNNSDYDSRDNCNAVIKTSYNELLLGCRDTIIPNTVTSIGRNAFRYNRLLSVLPTIPSSVTEIGSGAFESCTALTSAVLPNSITQLPQSIFSGCSSLLSVTIGNQVTSIGNLAFKNCTALTSINIPNTVTSIGESAFQNCTSLTFVVVNATTPPTLGSIVFDNTNNCPIYVPSASVDAYKAANNWSSYASRIQAIPEDVKPAFKFTSSVDSSKDITVNCEDTATAGTLTANDLGMSSQQIDEFRSAENTGSVEIGDCVKIYMAAACYTAKGISEVKLNEGLESIGDFAFGGMSALREITIPSTVTNISYQAFYADRALTSITCLATTPPTLGSDVFGDTNNCPIYVPASSLEDYKTASNWSTYASRIQAIPVHTALKWTSADGTQEISIACEDLETPGTLANKDIYTADPGILMTNVEGSAEIGDCVTTIEKHALEYSESLTSINIPSSVTSIGEFAFNGCSSLASITVNATTPPTLGTDPDEDIGDSLVIYVPAESVDAYKAASGWSQYADRIQAIPAE